MRPCWAAAAGDFVEFGPPGPVIRGSRDVLRDRQPGRRVQPPPRTAAELVAPGPGGDVARRAQAVEQQPGRQRVKVKIGGQRLPLQCEACTSRCQPGRVARAAGRGRPGSRRRSLGRHGAVRHSGRGGAHRPDGPAGAAARHRRGTGGRPRPGSAAHPVAARLPAIGRPRHRPRRPLPAQPPFPALARPVLRAVGRGLRRGNRGLLDLVGRTRRGDPRPASRRDPRRAARRSVLGALHPRPVRARPAERRRGGQEAEAAGRRPAPARHRRRSRPVLRAAVPPPSRADRYRARPARQRGGRPRDRRRGRAGGPGAVPRRGRDGRRPRAGQRLRRCALLQPRAPPVAGPDHRPARQGTRRARARRHPRGPGRLRRPGPPRLGGRELPRAVRLPQLGFARSHPRRIARLASPGGIRRAAPRPRPAHPWSVPIRSRQGISLARRAAGVFPAACGRPSARA